MRAGFPEFGEGWRFKIVLPSVLGTDAYRLFTVVAQSPDGVPLSCIDGAWTSDYSWTFYR